MLNEQKKIDRNKREVLYLSLDPAIKVRLTKLKEVDNPVHPKNIEEGWTRDFIVSKGRFKEPIIGECFYLNIFLTSPVQEIIDETTFSTLNSVYKWEIIIEENEETAV